MCVFLDSRVSLLCSSSCISDTFCAIPYFQGDGWCDDDNNIPSCDYDKGDCCLDPIKTHYCIVCACLREGNEEGGGGTATFSPSTCEYPHFINNGYCEDFSNTEECEFDGGDCCLEEIITTSCEVCMCYNSCMHCIITSYYIL